MTALILETKPLLDGTLRACVARDGVEIGWMTLAMKDGTEHAKVVRVATPEEAAEAKRPKDEEPVAASVAKGGALFVF